MANAVLRALRSVSEFMARFWPMSKTQEEVLAEQDARFGPLPDDEEPEAAQSAQPGPDGPGAERDATD